MSDLTPRQALGEAVALLERARMLLKVGADVAEFSAQRWAHVAHHETGQALASAIQARSFAAPGKDQTP